MWLKQNFNGVQFSNVCVLFVFLWRARYLTNISWDPYLDSKGVGGLHIMISHHCLLETRTWTISFRACSVCCPNKTITAKCTRKEQQRIFCAAGCRLLFLLSESLLSSRQEYRWQSEDIGDGVLRVSREFCTRQRQHWHGRVESLKGKGQARVTYRQSTPLLLPRPLIAVLVHILCIFSYAAPVKK